MCRKSIKVLLIGLALFFALSIAATLYDVPGCTAYAQGAFGKKQSGGDDQRRQDELRRQEEERKRQQDEARRQEEIRKQQEEARRKAELERARQEQEARQKEAERQEQIRRQRDEELRRQQEESLRQQELKRQQEEARKQEELRKRQEEEARQKAESERLQAERRAQEDIARPTHKRDESNTSGRVTPKVEDKTTSRTDIRRVDERITTQDDTGRIYRPENTRQDNGDKYIRVGERETKVNSPRRKYRPPYYPYDPRYYDPWYSQPVVIIEQPDVIIVEKPVVVEVEPPITPAEQVPVRPSDTQTALTDEKIQLGPDYAHQAGISIPSTPEEAIRQLSDAWLTRDADILIPLLIDEVQVKIYQNGKLSRSMESSEFYKLTAQAIEEMETEGFELQLVNIIDGKATAAGEHIYKNADGEICRTPVTYTLEHLNGCWVITETGYESDVSDDTGKHLPSGSIDGLQLVCKAAPVVACWFAPVPVALPITASAGIWPPKIGLSKVMAADTVKIALLSVVPVHCAPTVALLPIPFSEQPNNTL